MIEALRFAYFCFQLYRQQQQSLEGSGVAKYTRYHAGVADVALLFGTGREAWRVADLSINYFAERKA